MSKYQKPKPNEWVSPVRKGYRLRCCDCDLVHVMNFRVFKGKIQFQADRDYRATGASRKGKRYIIDKPAAINKIKKLIKKAEEKGLF